AADVHPAFHVAVSGNPQGRPVILIPGLASSGEVWNGTVAHYCEGSQPRFQCHTLTLAGFAGVAPIEGALLPAAEQQLADYIAAHHLAHPVVIGHSLGGFLALKLAADHPDQVDKLVIVDAVPCLVAATQMPGATAEQVKQAGEGMRRMMLAQDAATARAATEMAVSTMVTRPEDVQRVQAWGAQSDRATVINAMTDMMGDDMREQVGRIRAPTLVLGSWIAYKAYGTKDMFEQNYRNQYMRLPGVHVALADTARHFIMLDDPAWMYDRIDHFLN
ncbi:MAG: alpha/beta hydrolase, partial [Massilia sp.]|nr:alpha/beta hydrolase [Massilia sp.]